MPFGERIRYAAFLENREDIERRWHRQWGDRMNELVFIGQHINEAVCRKELEACLVSDAELASGEKWETDNFPDL